MSTLRLARWAAIASLAVAGCGSSATEADKTAPFVGPWTATGSQMGSCPGLIPSFNQPIDRVAQTITKGTDSDLVMTLFMGCSVKLDVAGNVATIKPGQTCSLTVMMIMAMGTITSGTFTVTGDTATFKYEGTGGLGPIACTFMASGTSVKGAPVDAGSTTDASGATTDASGSTGDVPSSTVDGP
jgi:hypothetical protein